MPRISTKNEITIPVAALEEVGLHAGVQITIDSTPTTPSGEAAP